MSSFDLKLSTLFCVLVYISHASAAGGKSADKNLDAMKKSEKVFKDVEKEIELLDPKSPDVKKIKKSLKEILTLLAKIISTGRTTPQQAAEVEKALKNFVQVLKQAKKNGVQIDKAFDIFRVYSQTTRE